jgi:hypothetical protein
VAAQAIIIASTSSIVSEIDLSKPMQRGFFFFFFFLTYKVEKTKPEQ